MFDDAITSIVHLKNLILRCRFKYLHGVHFPRIRFPASVDLPEPAAADYSVNREVVHAQVDVQFQILPLTKPSPDIHKNWWSEQF